MSSEFNEKLTPEYEDKFRSVYFKGLRAAQFSDSGESFRVSIEEYLLKSLTDEAVLQKRSEPTIYVVNHRRKRNRLGEPVESVRGVETRSKGVSRPLDFQIVDNYPQIRALYFNLIRPHLDKAVNEKNIAILMSRYVHASSYTEGVAHYFKCCEGAASISACSKRMDRALAAIRVNNLKVAG